MNQPRQGTGRHEFDDEIDVRELFRTFWRGKWVISGMTFVAGVVAAIIALAMPNVYQAKALLAPNYQKAGDGLSALAAQYSGLAGLAGLSLDRGSADETALGIEVLKSQQFISDFIERRDIKVQLFASKGWDSQSGELVIDSDEYDVATKKWKRKVKPPRKTTPSSQEAYEKFMRSLSVTQDRKTGFVTVAIMHHSPEIARQWTSWLIEDLNSSIMRKDVAEAERAIEYLEMQIENTSIAGLRNVFFGLIEEQTKVVMLARVSAEYLFKTIDPPVAPEKKAGPNRLLIVGSGILFGGLLGLFIVLGVERYSMRKGAEQTSS